LNPAGGIGKNGVLVNTPTLTWAYTRTEGEDLARPASVVSPIKQNTAYLHLKNLKMGYE
jgi:hypothetical protein